jgi:hypothetical protein
MRVGTMEENVRLRVGNILTRTLRVVKPSEMLKIDISKEQLKKVEEANEITVSCDKREEN